MEKFKRCETKNEKIFYDRILKFVDINNKNNCWVWWYKKTKSGYPILEGEYVHRLVYYLWYGVLPENKFVCHKCDNPSCVNPKHLFLGTHGDNIQDMVKKGRNAKGEKTNNNKLKNKQVREIKELFKNQYKTISQIADIYNVSRSTISNIINKKTWKHLV